jgi:hypothetical protein
VANIVQQRRAHQLRRRAGPLGELGALQRVRELRHALAFVGAVALGFVQIQYLFNYQGIEYVFTLVKLFIASTTPSLMPRPESLMPPKGVLSSR